MKDYLKNFYDKRLLTIFLFGISSGFPWVMIGSAMSAWLKEEGLSRSAIGLFGAVFISFSINFLWSPLVDRLKLPILHALLGQRRSWILLTQCLIAAGCVALAGVSPQYGLLIPGLAAMMVSISSATQDIAIDAYRIDIIDQNEPEKLAAAASMATSGWWTGFAGLGAIPFFLVDMSGVGWQNMYFLLAAIVGLLMIPTLFAKEPDTDREQIHQALTEKYQHHFNSTNSGTFKKAMIWLAITVAEPVKEFFNRNGFKFALSILLFIFLFKIGEAFLGRMSIVFYKEIGFTNAEIGFYSKLVSWWVTILFSFIGGLVTMRLGIVKGLLIGGLAMSCSNLMFALMASIGPDKTLFAATIFVDGFTSAWSSVAFVSFLSMMCSRSFTASQYALMASLGTMSRTLIASGSGFMVDWLNGNWAVFFIITTLMIIPSLTILMILKPKIDALERAELSEEVKK